VSKELSEVHQVITRNIQEILSRGQKIDCTHLLACLLPHGLERSPNATFGFSAAVTRKSEQLLFESRIYEKRTHWLNTKLFWRKWAPVIVVGVILLLVIILRFWWFY